MVKTRSMTAALAAATPVVINPAPADDDPDTVSDSGSSTTVPPPPPAGTTSVGIQQVELTVHDLNLNAYYRDTAKETNTFLRTYGRIPLVCPEGTHGRAPLVCPEGPYQDLTAVALPADGTRPRPLVCVFCKCAFCFSVDDLPDLQDPAGQLYPEPEVPITLNLLTPAAVAPLDGYRGEPPVRRGVMPPRPTLLVCDSDYHFKITMGMQQPGGAPKLDWLCAACLNVIPIVVATATSADLRRATAPPQDPLAQARAFWNYVEPGDEGLVELHLHDDPLNLTLGRR